MTDKPKIKGCIIRAINALKKHDKATDLKAFYDQVNLYPTNNHKIAELTAEAVSHD